MRSLPTGKDIDDFAELRFKPGTWKKKGIPEEGCRVRLAAFERIVEQQGMCGIDDLILGLMDWLDVTGEPDLALTTLRQLLDRHYPPDGQTMGRCHFVDEEGVESIFHVGAIDLAAPQVAWQRRDWIIAAAQPCAEPGRMLVGAPGPISSNTALRILALSTTSYMGEPFDSWIGALTSCERTAVFYLWEAGNVTPIRWDDGLDQSALASLPHSEWLSPNQLAIQVAIAGGYK